MRETNLKKHFPCEKHMIIPAYFTILQSVTFYNTSFLVYMVCSDWALYRVFMCAPFPWQRTNGTNVTFMPTAENPYFNKLCCWKDCFLSTPPPPKSFSPLDDYACCHILAAEVIHSGWEKSSLLWWQGKEKFSVSIGIISRSNYTFFYIFTHKSIIYVYFRAVWLVLCNTTFAYQNYIFLSLV